MYLRYNGITDASRNQRSSLGRYILLTHPFVLSTATCSFSPKMQSVRSGLKFYFCTARLSVAEKVLMGEAEMDLQRANIRNTELWNNQHAANILLTCPRFTGLRRRRRVLRWKVQYASDAARSSKKDWTSLAQLQIRNVQELANIVVHYAIETLLKSAAEKALRGILSPVYESVEEFVMKTVSLSARDSDMSE